MEEVQNLNQDDNVDAPIQQQPNNIATCSEKRVINGLKRYFPKGIDVYFENVGGNMLDERLRMEGFPEFDFRHKVPEYLEFAIQLIREKKLLFVEDIAEGLENAASAFVGIYHGRNVGKQIIQVSTD
ncbi:hypothetical protein KY285_007817 [Solanum tuberosum]|nr:hypothetical protein KY289_008210 [Solanum tuberosum]KAH0746160.1 hypothetical protein KY285_007817 [Solanum tuberosum]